MNLLEAVKYLRQYVLADTGGHRIDWTSITEDSNDSVMLRWNNEELVFFINEAMSQVYRRISPKQGHYTEFDIPILPDITDYTFDPRIIKITHARLQDANINLCAVHREDQDFENSGSWRDDKGTPAIYLVDEETQSIKLSPSFSHPVGVPLIPAPVMDTLQLIVTRMPMVPLTWDRPEDVIELRESMVVPMLSYAAHMAFSKDEANALDAAAASKYLQTFDRHFLFKSSYAERRQRRSTQTRTRYGGL